MRDGQPEVGTKFGNQNQTLYLLANFAAKELFLTAEFAKCGGTKQQSCEAPVYPFVPVLPKPLSMSNPSSSMDEADADVAPDPWGTCPLGVRRSISIGSICAR